MSVRWTMAAFCQAVRLIEVPKAPAVVRMKFISPAAEAVSRGSTEARARLVVGIPRLAHPILDVREVRAKPKDGVMSHLGQRVVHRRVLHLLAHAHPS